jgi:hypothetical protein
MNLKGYVGKTNCRILVAAHHGRESGICYEYEGKKHVYGAFLELMRPNLVIMSDKWGSETTDPEVYKPFVQDDGYAVYSSASKQYESKKVITTKTNNFVLISVSGESRTPVVVVP